MISHVRLNMAVMLWNFIEFKVVLVVGCYSMLWGKSAYEHQKDVNNCCSFEPSAIIGAKKVATFPSVFYM